MMTKSAPRPVKELKDVSAERDPPCGRIGNFQGSCRTNRFTHHAATVAAFFFAGLSRTVSMRDQFLVFPDHRCGFLARAAM